MLYLMICFPTIGRMPGGASGWPNPSLSSDPTDRTPEADTIWVAGLLITYIHATAHSVPSRLQATQQIIRYRNTASLSGTKKTVVLLLTYSHTPMQTDRQTGAHI
ncbi:hypothetical protein F5Y17DRAFT_436671 [Xylariaceae sp. FL0594]|nr:hypothetical protein F5Y17DRAFT_436671 [Xylariaceae sp. FL0594]